MFHPQTEVLVRNIDDLKEILVDAEGKDIKTHKGRDKKQFKEILQLLVFSSRINLSHKLEKNNNM